MITIFVKETQPISQKFYNDIVYSLDINKLVCTCGHCACFIHHGSYERTVKTSENKIRLRINRVKCNICGCTHAILISSIIPYSQMTLDDQTAIIDSYENKLGYNDILKSNFFIDENNIRSVILRYRKYWKSRILLYNILRYPLTSLVKQCFSIFECQFMQIRNTLNLLF